MLRNERSFSRAMVTREVRNNYAVIQKKTSEFILLQQTKYAETFTIKILVGPLRKPEILNVEDKQTKFERSNGDLGRVSEYYANDH